MSLTVHDAAGRPVTTGDTVGGTTSGNYQTTLIGPVLRVNLDRVKVLVTNRPTCDAYRPGNGDEVWITARRIFLVHQAAERTWRGFRSPDTRVWTLAARTEQPLYESPMVQARYAAHTLRGMYDGNLTPVWEDTPVGDGPAAIRSTAFEEAAGRIADLPQDYELDPGRGDAVQLLHRLAARERGAHGTDDTSDVVAYRNPDRPGVLLCRPHGDGWAGLVPLTADDLPDGGLCTYGRPDEEECGVDVLLPQTPHTT